MAPIGKEDFLKTRMKRRSNIFYQVEKACTIICYPLLGTSLNSWINSKIGVLFLIWDILTF